MANDLTDGHRKPVLVRLDQFPDWDFARYACRMAHLEFALVRYWHRIQFMSHNIPANLQ